MNHGCINIGQDYLITVGSVSPMDIVNAVGFVSMDNEVCGTVRQEGGSTETLRNWGLRRPHPFVSYYAAPPVQ